MRDPKAYITEHYNLVIWTVTLEVLLALLLVVVAHNLPVWIAKLPARCRFGWTGPASSYGVMSAGGIWFDILRRQVPANKEVWVNLRLTDGSLIYGYVSHYTSSAKAENREIAVQKPKHTEDMIIRDLKLDSASDRNLGRNWDYVIVRGEEIAYMVVSYQDV